MPGRNRSKIFAGLVWVFAASLHGEVKVLKNFTLIDGTGRPSLPSAAIIIDNGLIRWVGAVRNLRSPASAEVVDLTSKYVMPGIINLHGHIGITNGLEQKAEFFTRANIQKNLKTYASYGVTTVLSMGTDQDLIFKIRDQQLAGRPSEARVYTAGQGFVAQGSYGGIPGVNQALSGISEVEPAVAAQAAKHVDIIKLWIDDHLGAFQRKMPYGMARAIIDSAHDHNLRVAAHIFYYQDAKQLIDYGVDGLAHGVRDRQIDSSFVAEMKKHGTWQIASTLSREASMFIYGKPAFFLADPFFAHSVAPDVIQMLTGSSYQKTIAADPHFSRYPKFLQTAERNLKILADAGVKYGMGTDSGPPARFPGYFEHWEMQLMNEAGLTPMQVITASTRNGAEFLRATDLGTLEAGKWADLIVLDRNPLEDIKNTRTIHAVYIAGNPVNY